MMFPFPTGARAMVTQFIARDGKQEELLQTLQGLAEELRLSGECLEARLGADVEAPVGFYLLLAWKDVPAMQRSLASETFRVLLGAVSTLGQAGVVGFTQLEPLADLPRAAVRASPNRPRPSSPLPTVQPRT